MRAAVDDPGFVRLELGGPLRGDSPWRRVVVRPVEIRGERQLQFSYFDERRDVSKNLTSAEAREGIDEVLALPFGSIVLVTTAGTLQVQRTKGGKLISHRHRPADGDAPDLRHDRAKKLPFPGDEPDDLLIALGIQDPSGRVRPSRRAKLAQVNEFIKLIDHTGVLAQGTGRPVRILDAGCGSAYLTFALHRHLSKGGVPAAVTGLDTREDLIVKNRTVAASLGVESEVDFMTSTILAWQPPQQDGSDEPPDVVIALHACDTATDDALARGVAWDAALLIAAPCCHRHLHLQLERSASPAILGHGILKERMGDVLTDALRALILRRHGYAVDVVEFVSTEHTDMNVMIRAVRTGAPEPPGLAAEYDDLTTRWGVTPYLAGLLDPPADRSRPQGRDSGPNE